jgi:hypothetical protein
MLFAAAAFLKKTDLNLHFEKKASSLNLHETPWLKKILAVVAIVAEICLFVSVITTNLSRV